MKYPICCERQKGFLILIILIDFDGKKLGEYSLPDAQKIADEKDCDLVEKRKDEVYKLGDASKDAYQKKKKKKKKNKKKQNTQQKSKTCIFRAQIAPHDLEVKANQINEWLQKGYNVQVMVNLIGRMMEHQEVGFRIVNTLYLMVSKHGTAIRPERLVGNHIQLDLRPI